MAEKSRVESVTIDAGEKGHRLHFRILNEKIRKAIADGFKHIILENVNGQRFIGAGIKADDVTIEIYGDAGLDLGVFSEGLTILVHGCSEYLLGNTLCGGDLVVYGSSWDITGMGARGGSIFVMGNGGSRIGIHMKEYFNQKPLMVYGGSVKQYCGEYMAGGTIVVLGLDYSKAVTDPSKPVSRDNIDPGKIAEQEGIVQGDLGAGMHGGCIYVRGEVPDYLLGTYAVKKDFTEEDRVFLEPVLKKFSDCFNTPVGLLLSRGFTKIVPVSSRPFGKAYTTKPV